MCIRFGLEQGTISLCSRFTVEDWYSILQAWCKANKLHVSLDKLDKKTMQIKQGHFPSLMMKGADAKVLCFWLDEVVSRSVTLEKLAVLSCTTKTSHES